MWRGWIAISNVIIIVLFTTTVHAVDIEGEQLKVHFINVGQGDSILIQTPNEKTILVDAGPPKAKKKVTTYLKQNNIKKIDLLITTHPDIDHIGGVPHVLRTFDVKKILDSGKLHTTKTYAKYINEIKKQKVPVEIVKEGEHVQLDDLIKIEVLNGYELAKTTNESSLVLKVHYKDVTFLLMGDVGSAEEQKLIEKYDIDADVLKVAHHGSNTSTSSSFLKEVNPKIALITYSKNNDFGHPVKRVIKNLAKVDSLIYSTAVFGNVVITTNGSDYYVFEEKSPYEGL